VHDYAFLLSGDLPGSLALLPSVSSGLKIHCDSLTLDIIKLFAIQNLPYLTFFLRESIKKPDEKPAEDSQALITSHPLYEFILHSPSISFLSVWSIGQRCSNEDVLHHMKHSFELSNLFLQRSKSMKTLRIVNDDDNQGAQTYQRICSGKSIKEELPKAVVVFRFEPDEIPQVSINERSSRKRQILVSRLIISMNSTPMLTYSICGCSTRSPRNIRR
jgi:hypothetical protein